VCAALRRRPLAGKDNKSKAAAAVATALSLVHCTEHSGFYVVSTWRKPPHGKIAKKLSHYNQKLTKKLPN
jgi:hypothetical protein